MKQKETKDILQEDSFKMKKTVSFLFALMAIAFVLASCEKPAQKQETAQPVAEQKPAAPAPTEEAAAGFDEFPIGDEQDVGPLHVGGVYFQPVDMEPAFPRTRPTATLKRISTQMMWVKDSVMALATLFRISM